MSAIMKLIVQFENNREYSPEYIAEVFWQQQIAQVKTVTMYNLNGLSLVEVDRWLDTEVAFEFIKSLKRGAKTQNYDTMLVHSAEEDEDESYWIVCAELSNILPSMFGRETTEFTRQFFVPDEPEEPSDEENEPSDEEKMQEDTDELAHGRDFMFDESVLYSIAKQCCENVLMA
jgi:hypothetical protein